jgi:hypothetical protein
MESILASTEDHLVSNLSFKLPSKSGASYVTSKQQVTFFPAGGNIYSPTSGQKIIRFNLASDGYMDLSSLVVSMDISVGPIGVATPLVSAAHSLVTRLRWIISGSEAENIESFNVCSEMFHRLLPTEAQANVEL